MKLTSKFPVEEGQVIILLGLVAHIVGDVFVKLSQPITGSFHVLKTLEEFVRDDVVVNFELVGPDDCHYGR